MKEKDKPTDNIKELANQQRRANRLNSIRNGIDGGTIKEWNQIFAIVTETRMSIELGMAFNTLRKKVTDPGEFTINEIIRLAALFGVKYDVMADWIRDRIKAKSKSRIFRE